MTGKENLDLWSEFNLAGNNLDPGGGILYAVRYDTERLLEHRSTVIKAVVNSGMTISEAGGNVLEVDITKLSEDDKLRAAIMLEELSIINEAIEYHDAAIKAESIEHLSTNLRMGLLAILIDDQADAFDMARIGIPQIVRDIGTANSQNKVLSTKEKRIMRDLGEFASARARQIARNEIVIIDYL